MSATSTELKTDLKKNLERVRALRDEVRVQLHLANMELKAQWDKLEPRVADAERRAAADVSEVSRAFLSDVIKKLEKRHMQHIEVYGSDNDLRLTGRHETGHIGSFSSGVADRGSSIRIPKSVAVEGKGYFEDRRPASNIDPYQVCE